MGAAGVEGDAAVDLDREPQVAPARRGRGRSRQPLGGWALREWPGKGSEAGFGGSRLGENLSCLGESAALRLAKKRKKGGRKERETDGGREGEVGGWVGAARKEVRGRVSDRKELGMALGADCAGNPAARAAAISEG